MKEKCKEAYQQLAQFDEWEDTNEPWLLGDTFRERLANEEFMEQAAQTAFALVDSVYPSEVLKTLDPETLSTFIAAIIGTIWERGYEAE